MIQDSENGKDLSYYQRKEKQWAFWIDVMMVCFIVFTVIALFLIADQYLSIINRCQPVINSI
jgi:hypothetical protein